MELKPGYKQTEVGVIPVNWETQPLGKIAMVERGKFSARPRNDPKFFGGNIPFIQTGDVTNSDGKIESYSQNLNAQGLTVSKLFPADTLFFTIAANIGDVGICAFATACPDSLVSITPKTRIDKRWLFHLLRSQKKNFEGLATQNAQLNINLEKLNPFVIAVPPLPEQRAIAAALSDTDALLSSLDRLLAKKCDIKQAVMQQLLTGKQRLPGFRGVWEVKRLGDISYCLKGTGLSKTLLSSLGGNKCILYGQLFTTYGCVISSVVGRTSSKGGLLSEAGDVLMPGSTTTVGIDLAKASALLERDIFLGGDIIVIRQKEKNYDPIFMANYLTHIKKTEISELAQGITIIHLYGKDLVTLSLCLPKIDEQTAISAVLSDMDAEIDALIQRRDKTLALKQGMMQELLTGRTRLI